jgi:tRNA threonylcarbamoyladenosine biosynthesis protein TsaE
MLLLSLPSLAATRALAAALAPLARAGDVIVLSGEMGAGKTAFAQAFATALGVDEPVTSPTFTLVNSYGAGRLTLYHADLYRLERMAEVTDLALGELVETDGVLLVEWGDVAAGALGDHLELHLDMVAEDVEARMATLRAVGRSWAARWERLEAAAHEWVDRPC